MSEILEVSQQMINRLKLYFMSVHSLVVEETIGNLRTTNNRTLLKVYKEAFGNDDVAERFEQLLREREDLQ